MDVAKAMGHKEIVLSAGRTSEKAHMKEIGLPDESYVLMGDHLEYSLQEAKKHKFKKIHLCAQWAKMVKIAMATPQTHVRFGAIDTRKAVEFLNSIGISVPRKKEFNTAREIYDHILSKRSVGAIHVGIDPIRELHLQKVCNEAVKYAQKIAAGIQVMTYLVSYDGKVIVKSE
jgi:cobalt-precorrin-5B (C1)-methyltransferase